MNIYKNKKSEHSVLDGNINTLVLMRELIFEIKLNKGKISCIGN